ncbi:hypothetical protein [Pseudocolwellia agarivorans]|uniref:hypothetical protein n=1 Tax=Pseudocolwellia agarivorans TaxID=1911682 RepID=UPI003F882B8B
MDLLNVINTKELFLYFLVIIFVLYIVRGMFRLVVWSKKMPKGAFVFLAIFPLISIFPIPPQEIKKLERIKQEQIKEEDENGEPKDKESDEM